jgi:putative peptidoglycan lipid II flippase
MTEPTRPGEPPSPHYYLPQQGEGRDAPPRRATFTPRSEAPKPTLRPHGDEPGPGDRPTGARSTGNHAGRPQDARHQEEDRPRPTFTPREGYFPPPDARHRAAYPPPEMYRPAPGIPQEFTQPFNFPEELSRIPAPSPLAPDGARAPGRGTPDGARPPGGGGSRTRAEEAPRAASSGPSRAEAQPNLARASQAIALGTLVSRGSGFLRTFVLLYALGTGALADAYNNSNALPQTVYYLFLGGIFTSVVVPLLVKAAKNDQDRGEAYAERIFTLGVISLLTVTTIGTLLAGPLVDLYAGNLGRSPAAVAEHQQMVLLAHFSMPQIFFFGMDSLLGAILNTRGRFGANAWTPVINNVVVITVVGSYIATVGLHRTPLTVSPFGVRLLGAGALLGILIQSIALFPVLRRAGFSMHLRFDFRRPELVEIRRMAGWMLGYVGSQWAANVVVQRVANSAAAHGAAGDGYSAYFNSWQLFQLPYAVVGISVISALLPRMSGHATDRRYSKVREDFSAGVRLASVIVMPAAVFLAALGPPLCEFLFAHGSTSPEKARYIGEVFSAFSLGLEGFMLTQLQLRVFYAFRENRAPALIGMLMLVVGVAGDLVVLTVLPPGQVVVGLAAVYGLVTLTGATVAWPLQLRRVGSLDGRRITRSLSRMFLATLPGLAFAFATMAVVGRVLPAPSALYGLVSTVVGGGGAVLLYALCAKLLRIDEFNLFVRSVAGRLGRLPPDPGRGGSSRPVIIRVRLEDEVPGPRRLVDVSEPADRHQCLGQAGGQAVEHLGAERPAVANVLRQRRTVRVLSHQERAGRLGIRLDDADGA